MGARRKEKRNGVWIWTMDFEIGWRDGAALLSLLERLPVNKHVVGKCGTVNWNEWLRSMLRGKLNRLVRRTNGCAKSV